MNEKTKKVGAGIVGVIAGAGLMAGASAIQADEKITVENNAKKEKNDLRILVEAPAVVNYTIRGLQNDIDRFEKDILFLQQKVQQKRDLLAKLQAEVDKK